MNRAIGESESLTGEQLTDGRGKPLPDLTGLNVAAYLNENLRRAFHSRAWRIRSLRRRLGENVRRVLRERATATGGIAGNGTRTEEIPRFVWPL